MPKRAISEWSIDDIWKRRGRISFPDYQRQPKLWSESQKALLIDSIIRDIDIPSLYFHRVLHTDEYEVIDGQQRLWAIWGYLENEFTCKIGDQSYWFDELPQDLKETILTYRMHVTLISEVNDDYLRDLFVRLQLGLLLNTGEKLHARSGAMRDYIFDKLAAHPFIQRTKIPERRFAKETLSAQICANAFSRMRADAFTRTRYEDLYALVEEFKQPVGEKHKVFLAGCSRVDSTLDLLLNHCASIANVLRNRSLVLSVYLFAEDARQKSEREQVAIMKTLAPFIELLIKRLREEARLGINRSNEDLYKFQAYLSTAPGEKYQIERRHQKLYELYRHYEEYSAIKGDSH